MGLISKMNMWYIFCKRRSQWPRILGVIWRAWMHTLTELRTFVAYGIWRYGVDLKTDDQVLVLRKNVTETNFC